MASSTKETLKPSFIEAAIEENKRRATEAAKSTIARNLMIARSVTGLTQQALADRAGISRATIAQIEAAEADPRLSTLTDISSALGVNVFMLFIGEEEMNAILRITEEDIEKQASNNFSEEQLDTIKRLLKSGLQRNLIRASQMGETVSSYLQDRKDLKAAAIGAAIGTVIAPGVGSVAGAFLGRILGTFQETEISNKVFKKK